MQTVDGFRNLASSLAAMFPKPTVSKKWDKTNCHFTGAGSLPSTVDIQEDLPDTNNLQLPLGPFVLSLKPDKKSKAVVQKVFGLFGCI